MKNITIRSAGICIFLLGAYATVHLGSGARSTRFTADKALSRHANSQITAGPATLNFNTSSPIALPSLSLVPPDVAAFAGAPRSQDQRMRPERKQVIERYGKLPLGFEANRGQTDPRVKFLSRGRGYNLFLTPTEAVLALAQAGISRFSANR